MNVSVILPNFNYVAYLPQRIQSILDQDYTNFELLILDDASTDSSTEVILQYQKSDSRIRSLFNQKNTGNPFHQWKKGIEHTTGEYIWIAEADDWSDTSFLESALNYMVNHECDMVFCQSMVADSEGKVNQQWTYQSQHINSGKFSNDALFNKTDLLEELSHENICPNGSAVVFKRSAYNELGGVHYDLRTNADWHLWLKFATKYKIGYLSKPMNYFRRHDKSVIGSIRENGLFIESYDLTMRESFLAWINQNHISIAKEITNLNKLYISYDKGNKGLWQLENKQIIRGFQNLILASFIPEFKAGYIRKAFGWR